MLPGAALSSLPISKLNNRRHELFRNHLLLGVEGPKCHCFFTKELRLPLKFLCLAAEVADLSPLGVDHGLCVALMSFFERGRKLNTGFGDPSPSATNAGLGNPRSFDVFWMVGRESIRAHNFGEKER
jgi:hypothetical protein